MACRQAPWLFLQRIYSQACRRHAVMRAGAVLLLRRICRRILFLSGVNDELSAWAKPDVLPPMARVVFLHLDRGTGAGAGLRHARFIQYT